MAGLNFPNSPSDGDIFTSGDFSFKFDTAKGYWIQLTGETVATSAATLEASRNFSITGDITAANVAFNGSANVTLNATLDNGTVTAAKLNTASTLNIRDSAGSVLKTINFPGA